MCQISIQEVLARLRSAGVRVTEATNTLCLGNPVTFAPLPDGKAISELVLDMRDPQYSVLTNR